MSQLARYDVADGVATITLDDATVNCYTYEMNHQVDECILKARFDTNVHVIVFRGAGEKFFCAGANINMLQKADPVFKYYFCLHANETLSRLEQTPKLTIAAINGHCVGGGLEYAMACDLRIARTGGGKIGLPEVSLGVLPGTGGTQRLARLVGKSKSIEIMTEGKNFEFEEAVQLGIVNKIFEGANADEFMRKIYDYARQFCPPNKASMAVGHIKRAVQSGLEVPLEYGLALERELQAKLFSSADAKIGLNAYVEKQKPQFTGK
ncbi:MAG: enoyl-CoA hydratase/isomerase family protein [Planctomycetota bacterium]